MSRQLFLRQQQYQNQVKKPASSPTLLLDPQTIFSLLNRNQFIVAATLHKAVDA